jgi:hypothetical protein
MYQEFFSGSNLLVWPLVGLVIFVSSFVAVLLYVFIGLRDRKKVDHLAGLPLDASGELVSVGGASAGEGKVS